MKEASVEAGKRVDGDFSKLHVFWMGDAGPHDQMNNVCRGDLMNNAYELKRFFL